MNKRYYVAENREGFANTWGVLVFDSQKSANEYVEKTSNHFDGNNCWKAKVIKKSEVGTYAANLNLRTGRVSRPTPGSGEYFGVIRDSWANGMIGVVRVCQRESREERVF